MSDQVKELIPAATFAVGLTALGCGAELWDRARTNRNSETKESGTASRMFWYAAGAAFVGVLLMFRGAQDFSD